MGAVPAQAEAEQHVLPRTEVRHETRLLGDDGDRPPPEIGERGPRPLVEGRAGDDDVTGDGRTRPESRWSSVVFPDPDRPTTAISRPREMERSSSESTARPL